MGLPQAPQRERGVTIDSPAGNAVDADIEKGADDGAQDESDRQNHYNCHEISNPKRSVSIAAVTSPTEMSERHLALIGQGGV